METQHLFEEVEVEEFYDESYYSTFGVNDERPEDFMDLMPF